MLLLYLSELLLSQHNVFVYIVLQLRYLFIKHSILIPRVSLSLLSFTTNTYNWITAIG